MRKIIIKTTIIAMIAGVLLIVYTYLLELFSYDHVNVKQDWTWVSLTIIVLLIVLSFFYLKNDIQGASIMRTIFISTLFSLFFALTVGIESYVSTKYFEPDELSSYMEQAKLNWNARNYSPEVIASQVEHRMYASPFSFALSSASFLFFLSLFFFGSSVFINKFKERMNSLNSSSAN